MLICYTNDMHSRVLSFKYAGEGFWAALKEEPNLKFHFSAAILVTILGFLFNISREDWILIILLCGLVISLELTNTAIETVVDAFTDKEHPGAKLAKDISAAAVLTVSIAAFISGIIIFSQYVKLP